jgi:hypothetical protein
MEYGNWLGTLNLKIIKFLENKINIITLFFKGYPVMGMGPMGTVGPLMSEMSHIGPHIGHAHSYGPMGMNIISHETAMIGASMLGPEQIMNEASQIISGTLAPSTTQGTKEIIHCKSCTLFPPNPNAPPPTTRERPPGCRTIFVGGKKICLLIL